MAAGVLPWWPASVVDPQPTFPILSIPAGAGGLVYDPWWRAGVVIDVREGHSRWSAAGVAASVVDPQPSPSNLSIPTGAASSV